MKQKAQGDVLFTKVEVLPRGAVKVKGLTVALGEATGHHHTATAGTRYEALDKQWLVVPEGGSEVKHQEHGTIILDPGIYEVDLQIEVDPFTGLERPVFD